MEKSESNKCNAAKKPKQPYSNWFLIGETAGALSHLPVNLKIGKNTFGRSSSNNIKIPSTLCSNMHCSLLVTNDEIIVRDESTNGTYINGQIYQKSRQILSENDLIGFGVTTKPVDYHNKKAYVYRVAYRNHSETITLCDEEEEDESAATATIKQEVVQPSQNDFKQVVELVDSDDDSEPDESEPNGLEEGSGNVSSDMHMTQQELDTLDLDHLHTLQSKIKEEVGWLSFDYTRQAAAETAVVAEVIELDDDEDDDLIIVVEPPNNRASRKRPLEKDVESDEGAAKKPPTEAYSPQNGETPPSTSTAIHVVDDSINKKKADKCIKSVRVNPELVIRNKVKACVLSRGNKMLMDMLNIEYVDPVDSIKTAQNRKSLRKDPESTKTWVSPEIDETRLPKIKSTDINAFISEITEWPIMWFLDKERDAMINGMNYVYRPMDTDYDSLKNYQDFLKAYLKLELWHAVIENQIHDRCGKFIFSKLMWFKYFKRGENLERFVYQCQIDQANLKFSSFCIGDFVVVTHGRGRFFAFITDLDLKKRRNKYYVSLTMEASKVATNEYLGQDTKHLSIKNILNIEYDLEVLDALMCLNKSPLSRIIYSPQSNDFLLQIGSEPVGIQQYKGTDDLSDQQLRAFWTVYRRILHSLDKKIPTIQLIQGGAGTGKTTLLSNLAIQCLIDQEDMAIDRKRILVCAASDRCIDSIASKIFSVTTKIVRFGNHENIHPDLHDITSSPMEKDRSNKIDDADIVCTTFGCCINLCRLSKKSYDLCIIDEATFCSDFTMQTVLRLKFNTLLLVGDGQIKAPSIMSPKSRENGLAQPLFSRMIASHENDPRSLYPVLNVQYRMHPEILSWPNEVFYDKAVYSAAAIVGNVDEFPLKPYVVFDIEEDSEVDVGLKPDYFDDEANFAVKCLNILTRYADQTQYSYGIVTSYMDSKRLIDEKFRSSNISGIEVSSFDCLQSTQKDIIIILATKSRPPEILDRPHSLLTALTRAKKSLIIFSNFSTKKTNLFKLLRINAHKRGLLFSLDNKEIAEVDLIGALIKYD